MTRLKFCEFDDDECYFPAAGTDCVVPRSRGDIDGRTPAKSAIPPPFPYCLIWEAHIKGAQVWDFDVLDFNDFFIMKSL